MENDGSFDSDWQPTDDGHRPFSHKLEVAPEVLPNAEKRQSLKRPPGQAVNTRWHGQTRNRTEMIGSHDSSRKHVVEARWQSLPSH